MPSKEVPGNVRIESVRQWPPEEIVELYRAGGWWSESYDLGGVGPVIEGSFAFVVAVDAATGRAVGMGRAVSDGVSDAWLQDIVVLPEYRGRGLGRALIRKLLDICLEAGLVWIGLVAEPGTGGFYRELGFDVLEGEPMVYKRV